MADVVQATVCSEVPMNAQKASLAAETVSLINSNHHQTPSQVSEARAIEFAPPAVVV